MKKFLVAVLLISNITTHTMLRRCTRVLRKNYTFEQFTCAVNSFNDWGLDYTPEIKKALKNGANPNMTCKKTGYSALHIASQIGHTKIVKALLDAGADINAKSKGGLTAKTFAALGGHRDTLRALDSYKKQ